MPHPRNPLAAWIAVGALALTLTPGCRHTPLPPPSAGDVPRWEKAIASYEAADRTNPPPPNAILFIGSSSIRMWTNVAKDFPQHQVINRGFGGSQIADSVAFAGRIVIPYRPRQIVMYAGGNDLNARKSPAQVAADFKAFVGKVRAALPDTRITYISIAPNPKRWGQIEQVRAANRLIRNQCRRGRGLEFIDMHPHMLGPDGLPRPDIFLADQLHMNAKGYAIWREIIGPHLR
jgi:lysophospholipase L1-like esterase